MIGMPSSSVYAKAQNITIKPSTISGSLYTLTEFKFGTYNVATGVESMTSIINNGNYGVNTNASKIALDFRGIGLPTASYAKFVNLLGIASQGTANCIKNKGGYCVLPQ